MTNGENQSISVFEKYVGNISQLKKVCKLGEELAELAIAIANNDYENIEEEIGDCAAILLHIAYKQNPKNSLTWYIMQAAEKMENRNQKINHEK